MTLRTDLLTAARLAAGRALVWGFAVSGDHGARILRVTPVVDPYPHYERVRDSGELYLSRLRLHLTASHALSSSILRDPRFGVVPADEFTSVDWTEGASDPGSLAHPIEDSLLGLDPPAHTRLRRIASPWFTPRAIRQRTESIERVVREHLDEIGTRDRFDLMRDFASRVPVRVICDLFGIQQADHSRLMRWGSILGNTLDGIRTLTELRQVRWAVGEMGEFFDDLVARRRREPGDDVLSGLLGARPDGEELSRNDLVALAGLLLGAGFETTVNLIGNGVLALLANPEAKRLIVDEPQRAADVTDEVLRYDPPVQYTARLNHEPLTIAGTELPKRSTVALLLAGANRDPAVFSEPHRFDPLRPNNREHLSFSSGVHYCLGAGLARLEGEVALRELFTRFPDLRQAAPARRRPSRTIRGVLDLPVSVGSRRFTAA